MPGTLVGGVSYCSDFLSIRAMKSGWPGGVEEGEGEEEEGRGAIRVLRRHSIVRRERRNGDKLITRRVFPRGRRTIRWNANAPDERDSRAPIAKIYARDAVFLASVRRGEGRGEEKRGQSEYTFAIGIEPRPQRSPMNYRS